MESEKIEYWQELNEEYSIPFDDENESILDWARKEKQQRDNLIDKYGESSWHIHRFMESCRSETISESMFRQLVRYEINKVCEKQKNS